MASASPPEAFVDDSNTPTVTAIIPGPPQRSIQALISDPPPPYPSPRRTRRVNNRSQSSPNTPEPVHLQVPSSESAHEPVEETTPLLGSNNTGTVGRRRGTRPRSGSHTGSVFSSVSVAPSLSQTVTSLFQTEYDSDYGGEDAGDEGDSTDEAPEGRTRTHEGHQYTPLPTTNNGQFTVQDEDEVQEGHRSKSLSCWKNHWFLSKPFWRRYYHPFTRKPYYHAFIHLAVINFPFALLAWIYLFVFTLTGTALLITLPIGALLCFLNAIGARTFARGELYLQTKFHKPSLHLYPALNSDSPYPHPYPLFIRLRPPTAAEIESGLASRGDLLPENSFYRNSYAMFADPTTYQSLFYFLVIKPAITLGLSLLIVIVFVPMIVLGLVTGGLTVPPAMRAVRRLGRWQAGVAIDGLVPIRRT
ncbi:hypothetical protein E1B28_000074 [Marasmius oreades]|uniref:Uncharacterized protein n=1 Tax=Marasmius oreades TaxID=181124 RepID=A0A9P8AE84_9AGAR|nr:uncharacterized protein E1B28_000074 [Marasmius oreades]KAG7098100.1 hypothetical protein E1B28_000074 [Marasmius oreades]